MGFGFNFFFVFILVPLTGILLVTWLLTRKKIFGKTLGLIWLGIFGLIIFSTTVQTLTAKKELKKMTITESISLTVTISLANKRTGNTTILDLK